MYERELMVMVGAVKKCRHYLIGHKFIICTDQHGLKSLLVQRMITKNHQKMVVQALRYDFDIEYKSSSANRVVNALFRLPSQPTLFSLFVPRMLQLEDLSKEIFLNPTLSA